MTGCIGGALARDDPRKLHLEDYVNTSALAGAPPEQAAAAVPAWHQLGNDRSKDCAMAAAGHAEQLWAAPGTPRPEVTTDGVLAAFREARDAVRQRGAGIAALDALNHWRQRGVCDHRIAAYAAVRHADVRWVRFAIHRFGCAYAVLALPDSVVVDGMTRETAPAWDTVHGPKNFDHDHAVIFIDYDRPMNLTAVTWGETRPTTWAFNQSYCDEMYVALRPGDEFDDVDVARWLQDAAEIEREGPRA